MPLMNSYGEEAPLTYQVMKLESGIAFRGWDPLCSMDPPEVCVLLEMFGLAFLSRKALASGIAYGLESSDEKVQMVAILNDDAGSWERRSLLLMLVVRGSGTTPSANVRKASLWLPLVAPLPTMIFLVSVPIEGLSTPPVPSRRVI
ncbi:MAG: hypothetical protein Q9167_002180 [Letrouitia subvulpina]